MAIKTLTTADLAIAASPNARGSDAPDVPPVQVPSSPPPRIVRSTFSAWLLGRLVVRLGIPAERVLHWRLQRYEAERPVWSRARSARRWTFEGTRVVVTSTDSPVTHPWDALIDEPESDENPSRLRDQLSGSDDAAAESDLPEPVPSRAMRTLQPVLAATLLGAWRRARTDLVEYRQRLEEWKAEEKAAKKLLDDAAKMQEASPPETLNDRPALEPSILTVTAIAGILAALVALQVRLLVPWMGNASAEPWIDWTTGWGQSPTRSLELLLVSLAFAFGLDAAIDSAAGLADRLAKAMAPWRRALLLASATLLLAIVALAHSPWGGWLHATVAALYHPARTWLGLLLLAAFVAIVRRGGLVPALERQEQSRGRRQEWMQRTLERVRRYRTMERPVERARSRVAEQERRVASLCEECQRLALRIEQFDRSLAAQIAIEKACVVAFEKSVTAALETDAQGLEYHLRRMQRRRQRVAARSR
jgi:hypothetical protein